MVEPWKVLMAAGVPWGAIRPVPRGPFDGDAVRAALAQVLASLDAAPEGQRDALLAWLRGFRHHWPRRYADELGSEAETSTRGLVASDENRYLKLRRIAIENLAGML